MPILFAEPHVINLSVIMLYISSEVDPSLSLASVETKSNHLAGVSLENYLQRQ